MENKENMIFILDGKRFHTTGEGYLSNEEDWSFGVAEFMAAEDNCVLTENHWTVINLIRDYYHEHQIAPGVRLLVKQIGKKLGKDKANSRYLYRLFPEGPAKQACKYAGLPKPTGCI